DPTSHLRPGLTLAGGWSTVRGLDINRFMGGSGVGIELTDAGNNIVQGNFIGTDVSGTRLAGSPPSFNLDPAAMWTGINVEGTSDHNRIGTYDDGSGAGNVVCGTGAGIVLRGPGGVDDTVGGFNVVSGNSVGVGVGYLTYDGTIASSGLSTYLD